MGFFVTLFLASRFDGGKTNDDKAVSNRLRVFMILKLVRDRYMKNVRGLCTHMFCVSKS